MTLFSRQNTRQSEEYPRTRVSLLPRRNNTCLIVKKQYTMFREKGTTGVIRHDGPPFGLDRPTGLSNRLLLLQLWWASSIDQRSISPSFDGLVQQAQRLPQGWTTLRWLVRRETSSWRFRRSTRSLCWNYRSTLLRNSQLGPALKRLGGKQADFGSNPLQLSFNSCGLWTLSCAFTPHK